MSLKLPMMTGRNLLRMLLNGRLLLQVHKRSDKSKI